MEEKEQARMALAQQFFDLAINPAAMRSSLSRLYYANYHLAVLLTGGTSHGDIAKRLRQVSQAMGDDFKNLRDLRNRMDYAPEEFIGKQPVELIDFYAAGMRKGALLFDQLSAALEGEKP